MLSTVFFSKLKLKRNYEERKKRAELVADYTQFLLDNNSLSVAKLVPAIKNKNPAFNTVEAELNFIQSYSEEASLGIMDVSLIIEQQEVSENIIYNFNKIYKENYKNKIKI